jgi:cysteine desulfurase
MRRETYLDWNATAPLRPEAAAAMSAAMAQCGNPSSVHRWGRAARGSIERARASVAALVDAPAEGVIFTSGGTEANHLALLGSGRARILVSSVEHDSVLAAAPGAERVPVDRDGRVDPSVLARMLAADARPALVSVMLANNETGIVQPVAALAAVAHAAGAIFHCDAVQAAGRMAVSLRALGADLLTLSAHKIGGPLGVGALVARSGCEPAALLRGGGQERSRRAGSENVPGIAGFGVAASLAGEDGARNGIRERRDALERVIADAAPEAVLLGAGVERLPNTVAVALPGIPAETQVIALDLDGVMVSAGAACSSGKVGPSHVLAAMGIAPEIARAMIRISLGPTTGDDDIAHFLDAWIGLRRRHRRLSARAA